MITVDLRWHIKRSQGTDELLGLRVGDFRVVCFIEQELDACGRCSKRWVSFTANRPSWGLTKALDLRVTVRTNCAFDPRITPINCGATSDESKVIGADGPKSPGPESDRVRRVVEDGFPLCYLISRAAE